MDIRAMSRYLDQHARICVAVGTFLLLASVCLAQPLAIHGTQVDVDIYGNIYVLDAVTSTLRIYDSNGVLKIEGGGPGWENGRFDQPTGLWARNGIDVFVADYANHRVQRFDRSLSFVSVLSTRESENPEERFGYPGDVALSRLGELYVCDTENSRIVKVSARNTVETTFGGFGGGAGRLNHPVQVETGAHDCVYVLDPPRVLLYDSFGNFLSSLPEGYLKNPSVLFADEAGCVVVDGGSVGCFDTANRPLLFTDLSRMVNRERVSVHSLVIASGRMFVLCDEGVFVLPDPRPSRLD